MSTGRRLARSSSTTVAVPNTKRNRRRAMKRIARRPLQDSDRTERRGLCTPQASFERGRMSTVRSMLSR
jgi:hypothetical protein